MSILGGTFFFLTFISYSQSQEFDGQNSAGRIIGCIVGGLFALLFLLLFLVLLTGRRRRRQMVVNGPLSQQESKPSFGGPCGRSHPVQQNFVPMTPYGPQELAQTSSGNVPPVQHDPVLYNTDYYSQIEPPPAYANDPNVKGADFTSSGDRIEGQNTSDIPYNPPPFPPAAHVTNGQENNFVGGFRS